MQKSMYVIPETNFIMGGTPHEYPLVLRDLPPESKPREKLLSQGPESLSIRELTILLLVTGTTKEEVMEMATRIVQDYGEKNIFFEKNPEKLSKDLNIPIVKACQIVAAGELGRRLYDHKEQGFTVIRNASDVYEYVADMRSLSKEHLRGLYLNGHNRIIRDEVISIGTVNANIIHAREVFRTAIECNAVAVVLVHNHPSGEAVPSTEDVQVTEKLIQAGKLIGIRVLDHVLVTKNEFVSIRANY